MRAKQYYSAKIKYPNQVISGLSPSEHLFCQMILILGYSVSKAYVLAISPSVTASSAASLGCRLLSEDRIQNYLWNLYRWRDNFTLKESVLQYQ